MTIDNVAFDSVWPYDDSKECDNPTSDIYRNNDCVPEGTEQENLINGRELVWWSSS